VSDRKELEARTQDFALLVARLVGSLPRKPEADVLGRQLVRAGTSIGANYREANHACSLNDFIHKIGIAEKEAAETEYWLELIKRSAFKPAAEVDPLLDEAHQLLAILSAIEKTSKDRRGIGEEDARGYESGP
jgi:four helix bundle protein